MSEASILCARHTGTEAIFTCSRCGSFGCELCQSSAGASLCVPCQETLVPAVLRGGVDLPALLKGTFQQIAEHFRGWVLIIGLWSVLSWLFWSFLAPRIGLLPREPSFGLQLLESFLYTLLTLLLDASIIRWMADGAWGRTPHSLGAALWAGLSNFPRMTALWVLYAGGILMGGVALLIPGLILATCWYLAPIALVLERTPVVRSLGRSFDLTSEHRWLVFFLIVLGAGLSWGVRILDEVMSSLPERTYTTSLVFNLISTLLSAMTVAVVDTSSVILYLRLTRGGVRAEERARH